MGGLVCSFWLLLFYVWCWCLRFLSLSAVYVLLLLVVEGYVCGVGDIAALACW